LSFSASMPVKVKTAVESRKCAFYRMGLSESYCTVVLSLSSRMHNLNLALREVSTTAYDEQRTHLW
jgi:hypothetical protein